jgi:hypothetical protein
MTTDNLWQRVRRKPFEPFRLNLSSGESYVIRHPEMIFLSRSSITVAVYEEGDRPGEALPAREVFISPLHVTSAEDLPVESAA